MKFEMTVDSMVKMLRVFFGSAGVKVDVFKNKDIKSSISVYFIQEEHSFESYQKDYAELFELFYNKGQFEIYWSCTKGNFTTGVKS